MAGMACLVMMVMTACSGKREPPAYLSSRLLPPLEVPAGLSRPQASNEMVVPPLRGTPTIAPGDPSLEIPPGFGDGQKQ